MKNVQRVKWLSQLDMEPLLGAVLRVGMLLSVSLMAAAWVVARTVPSENISYEIHAISVLQLLQVDLNRMGSPDFWYRFLVDLGFSILMITPYARLMLTGLYLIFVKKHWRYAAYTSISLLLLGIVMFSDVVLSPGLSGFLQWYPFKD